MAELQELPANLRDAMRRQVNTGLMVTFINADLFARSALDVRTSVVLYDDAGVFEAATNRMPDAELQHRLVTETAVRYYSIGIV